MQCEWAELTLNNMGLPLNGEPQTIQRTPWSHIQGLPTAEGRIILKTTSPFFSLEARTTQSLHDRFVEAVPEVLAIDEGLHCFLMRDAGVKLREDQPEISEFDKKAIAQYQAIQQHAVPHIEAWLALGIPDWRLDKLPVLYAEMIDQTDFLAGQGVLEFSALHRHLSALEDLCQELAACKIAETLDHCDFHERNILIHPQTKSLTIIDWAEIVITHPYFSWINYLKKSSQGSETLFSPHPQAWTLAQKIWPVYAALAFKRLIEASDPAAFRAYYASRPHRIAEYLQAWLHHAG